MSLSGPFRYFKESEVQHLDREFVCQLDQARHFSQTPYLITSGFRSPEHNMQVSGKSDSSHLRGLGVDLSAPDSVTRFKILKGLIMAGFNRIGIYSKHIHVDRDQTLPQEVAWIGEYREDV